jgi:hypothetical protein
MGQAIQMGGIKIFYAIVVGILDGQKSILHTLERGA